MTWENRRLNSLGHRFSVTLEASQVERYLLQARYIIPIGDPAVENLTFQGTVDQLQLADVLTHTQSVGPSITAQVSNWQYVLFANATKTTDDTVVGSSTERMVVPGIDVASVPKGYLGEPIFQHPFFAELRGSNAAIGSDSNFLQLHMQAEHVFQIADKWHLLLRDEVGATLVSNFDRLPAIMRFFAGGDNSVRGFAFDGLLAGRQSLYQRSRSGSPTAGQGYPSKTAVKTSSPARSKSSATYPIISGSPPSSTTATLSIISGIRSNMRPASVSGSASPS